MHVASLCFNRGEVTSPPEGRQYVTFGQLFYDEQEGRASIKLTGLRTGAFIAKAKSGITHPPLLEGDLCVWTGDFYKDSTRKVYQWIGHIHTSHDSEGADGTAYVGSIDVLPIKGGDRKEASIYLSVFHWDQQNKDSFKAERPNDVKPDIDAMLDEAALKDEGEEVDDSFPFGANEPKKAEAEPLNDDALFGTSKSTPKPDPVVVGKVEDWPPKGVKTTHKASIELPF